MSPSMQQVVPFDFTDPALPQDPWPRYELLRTTDPVHEGANGFFYVSTYQYAKMVLSEKALFGGQGQLTLSAEILGAGSVYEIISYWLFFLDPPQHTRLRSLVSKAFSTRLVEKLDATIVRITEELLTAVRDRGTGTMDVIADLAFPLPVLVTCHLLGVPPEDRELLHSWTTDALTAVGLVDAPGVVDRGNRAMDQFKQYFRRLLAQRREEPRDDLLSALVQAKERGDQLSAEELVAMSILLFMAGYETTKDLIGCAVLSLLQDRAELAKLQAVIPAGSPGASRPPLVANAVEEALRYWTPAHLVIYNALRDVPMGRRTIPAGRLVIALLGAADRDDAMFPNADAFDIERPNAKEHLALGHGIHFCVGARLARLVAQIAIAQLAVRMPDLQLAADPATLTWKPSLQLRGLASLPAAY